MDESTYQVIKTSAALAAFVAVALLQWRHPAQATLRQVARNWRTNLALGGINVALVGLFCQGCACAVARFAEAHGLGLTNILAWPTAARVVVAVLALDLTAYLWHLANHRIGLLWRFHAVHHSDVVYETSTALRFHPMEVLLALPLRLGVVLALGIPISGVLAFELLYTVANFFEHGDLRLPGDNERLINLVFVTPAMHRKHHERLARSAHGNFATIFSIWDRLFSSFAASTPDGRINVGLVDVPMDLDVGRLLLLPARGTLQVRQRDKS